MRGQEDDRDVLRALALLDDSAVSKPSMSGIWTSSRITAKSSLEQLRAAPPRPTCARTRSLARAARAPPRARAGSPAGRRRAGCSTWRRLTRSPCDLRPDASSAPISSSGRTRSHRAGAIAAARHRRPLGRRRVLHDRQAAAPLACARARRRRRRLAPVSSTPTTPSRRRRRPPTRTARRSTAALSAPARRSTARSAPRSTSRW